MPARSNAAARSMAQIIQSDLGQDWSCPDMMPAEPPQLSALQYNGLAIGTGRFRQMQPGVQFGSPYFGPLNNWSGFTIPVATLLPRVATMARVRGVKYDIANILGAPEAWRTLAV